MDQLGQNTTRTGQGERKNKKKIDSSSFRKSILPILFSLLAYTTLPHPRLEAVLQMTSHSPDSLPEPSFDIAAEPFHDVFRDDPGATIGLPVRIVRRSRNLIAKDSGGVEFREVRVQEEHGWPRR